MEVARIWFDFKGRMNRGKYWFVTVANFLVIAAAVLIAIAAESWALGILAGLIWLVLIISAFAVPLSVSMTETSRHGGSCSSMSCHRSCKLLEISFKTVDLCLA